MSARKQQPKRSRREVPAIEKRRPGRPRKIRPETTPAVVAEPASRPLASTTGKVGKRAEADILAPMANTVPAIPVAVETPEAMLALDVQLKAVREAVNKLACELQEKRIELDTLRVRRRALAFAMPKPKKGESSPRHFGLLDAAAQVLSEAKEPMRVKELLRTVYERGLWRPVNGGRTPEATLAAAMGREIALDTGDSRFVKVGRGLFAAKVVVIAP